MEYKKPLTIDGLICNSDHTPRSTMDQNTWIMLKISENIAKIVATHNQRDEMLRSRGS